jgi:hypothetical protein
VAKGDPIPDRVGVPVLALFAALMIAAFLPFASSYLTGKFNGIDFEAFYCGGRVMATGGNPYLQEPLHTCESHVHWTETGNKIIVPVPQPPVVIAAFVPFGLLPYSFSRAVWFVLLCAAIAASIALLRTLYSVPWAAVAAPVILSSILSLTLEQVITF